MATLGRYHAGTWLTRRGSGTSAGTTRCRRWRRDRRGGWGDGAHGVLRSAGGRGRSLSRLRRALRV